MTTWSLQPSSRKPSPLQSALDVRTLTHQPPDEARAVILDHGDDWTLIDAEVVVVEPADAVDDVALLCAPAGVVIGGVEGVEKSVLAEERITVFAAHRPQGGHGNLGSERQRASRSGRRKRAVVANVVGGRAARRVSVKLPRHVVHAHRRVDRAIGRRETPDVGSIVANLRWIR